MNAGIHIKQRAIVLVLFPYSDLSDTKKRPVLVISNDRFNSRNDDVICCLITSNPKDVQHGVYISKRDMEAGFLEFDSKIKPYRLFSVNKSIIYKTLGILSVEKYAFINLCLGARAPFGSSR